MLLTNQRIDKLVACRVHLTRSNLLVGPCLAPGVVPIIPLPPPGPPLLHDPDDEALDAPRAIASVSLAKTRGKSRSLAY